jgi:hypothetical protein
MRQHNTHVGRFVMPLGFGIEETSSMFLGQRTQLALSQLVAATPR